jgi:hypothetical protein
MTKAQAEEALRMHQSKVALPDDYLKAALRVLGK